MRSVPDHIGRPPYAETGQVKRRAEPAVKSPDIIARMRHAGATAATVAAVVGGGAGTGPALVTIAQFL